MSQQYFDFFSADLLHPHFENHCVIDVKANLISFEPEFVTTVCYEVANGKKNSYEWGICILSDGVFLLKSPRASTLAFIRRNGVFPL